MTETPKANVKFPIIPKNVFVLAFVLCLADVYLKRLATG